ncbi:MAG: hypothetical protein ABSH42_07855 [Bryobacteraceae bacterium]
MKNRSPRPRYAAERVLPGPADDSGQAFAIRQQLWERAQRLYAIGELNLAAQLLAELAAVRHPRQAEAGGEAVNG